MEKEEGREGEKNVVGGVKSHLIKLRNLI